MLYVTTQHEPNIKNRFEGDAAVGHFFLAWLAGPCLSQKYGLRYIYNDIVPNYLDCGWNEFLGFDEKLTKTGLKRHFLKEEILNSITEELPKINWPAHVMDKRIQNFIKNYSCSSITEEKNLIIVPCVGQSFDVNWQYYLNQDLRERYNNARQENPMVSYNRSTFVNVGVHIRRGDVGPNNTPERWISNEQYIHLFKNIIDVFKDDCLLHIYSEGENSDFKDIIDTFGSGVELHLNYDPMITFHNLVVSDILVNAKSAFSVLAAYLHKGPKLCVPFSIYWNQTHPDNDNFKDLVWVNDNMDFDSKKLMN